MSGGHTFKEGQQVTISGSSISVDSVVASTLVCTVRKPTSTTFEAFDTDGITPLNFTSAGGGTANNGGVVVCSNIVGAFNFRRNYYKFYFK